MGSIKRDNEEGVFLVGSNPGLDLPRIGGKSLEIGHSQGLRFVDLDWSMPTCM